MTCLSLLFPCFKTKISSLTLPRGSSQYCHCLSTILRCLCLCPLSGWSPGKVVHLLLCLFVFIGQIFFLILNLSISLSLVSPENQLRLFLTLLTGSSLFCSVTVFTTDADEFSECLEDPFALKTRKSGFRRSWLLFILFQLAISVLLAILTVCLVLSLKSSPLTTYRLMYSLLLTLVSLRLYFSTTVFYILLYSTFRCARELNEDLETFKGGPLGTTVFKLQRLCHCLSTLSRLSNYSLGLLLSPLLLLVNPVDPSLLLCCCLLLLPGLILTLLSVLINFKLDHLKVTGLRLLEFQMMAGSTSVMISYFSFISRVEHLKKLTVFGFLTLSRPVIAAGSLCFVVIYLRREY